MAYRHSVLARFYTGIGPLERGERYEDQLQAVLEAARAGEVTGGGSQLSENGEIESADVEIELANLDDALQLAVDALERAGAPQGSEILGDDGQVLREFGHMQCL